MNEKSYLKRVKETEAGQHNVRDILRAFFVGGGICFLSQILKTLYTSLFNDEKTAFTLVSVTLIFLACLFTGIGWFDALAKFAGAGTLVPITGFANAVASPAIDCKNEGWINGVGSKMFIISGPVIVYGVVASVIYGLIYWLTLQV